MENNTEKRSCKLGVWDKTVPGITFDENGISNYARIQQHLMQSYPRGTKGEEDWSKIVESAKIKGKNKKYDCIVGISGGVDSSYMLYQLKNKYGLRPLAVTLDNGWSTEIAVQNIKKMTDALKIDLETYVIDYEEIKDLLRSFMYAGLPWIDTPTDIAIKSVMYKYALQEGVAYIFRGNDFRTEGKQPREWTYCDGKMLKYVHKKFGRIPKLKTFPYLSLSKIIYSGFVKSIKDIRPFYYLDYSKDEAKEFLEKEFGWNYYGGHHHENIFTKYTMSVWLPEKFGIDKRIINLSAQVMSGLKTREIALQELKEPAINEKDKNEIVKYVIKKLDLNETEYAQILKTRNKTYREYPNYEGLMLFVLKNLSPLIKFVYPQKPMTFVEMEINKSK